MTPLLFFLALHKITFAAGYIPNIQFAPFYVAVEKGFYRDEGLDIEFDYTIGPDVLKLVALDKIELGSVDPDAFLLAAKRGLPLIHVATLYQRYPVCLISKFPVSEKEDLMGKHVGISGTFGTSYLGLKALLGQMDMSLKDIRLHSIGYNQASFLKQGKVDAVIGYINNEPVILENQGVSVHTLSLSAHIQLPGVGLMTGRAFRREHPEWLKGFLLATFKGVAYVLAHSEESFELVMENYLDHLNNPQHLKTTREVFDKTLPFFSTEGIDNPKLGQCDTLYWEHLVALMQREGLLDEDFHWEKTVDLTFNLNSR
jgi:NitT/TauT family transport system substrate-binding protein